LDPRTNEQTGQLNALAADFQRSTADNLLNAHKGYQLTGHVEEAGHLVAGSFNYTSFSLDGRYYLPIGNSMVIASRVQAGSIQPAGGDQANIPFSKRYFLGGATSVRGWGRYELSPLSSGLPIGGDSLLAFSEELRTPLSGNLGGVVFLDAG